jgi:hypothetical protein
VREHYASHDTEMPNLLALVPAVPWTYADVVETRSHGERPVAHIPVRAYNLRRTGRAGGNAAAAVVPAAALPIPVPTFPILPAAPAAPEDGGNGSGNNGGDNGGGNGESQDISPYGHWPSLPRSPDPDVLDPDILESDLRNGGASPRYKRSFLNGRSLMPEDEGDWQGAEFLASGSYGAVGLWCRIDGHNNVIDRMVIKDNSVVSRRGWHDPKNWRDRLRREIAVHRRIETRRAEEPEACQYINRHRGYRLLMSKRRYRLYADFASGGDLYRAVMPYHNRWEMVDVLTQSNVFQKPSFGMS